MAGVTVIARETGVREQVSAEGLSLKQASIVVLDAERSEVASLARQGLNLVVTLTSGEIITIANFFANWPSGAVSELVLQEDDGSVWWLRSEGGVELMQFSGLDAVDQLLLLPEATNSGAGALPIILGGVGLGGLVAVAAGGGGGSDTTPPGDYREFRVWAGILGKKEFPYVPTQRPCDPV